MPTAQRLHRKIHSVRGVGKRDTAGTYLSYFCSIGWGGSSCCCRCFWVHNGFLRLFLYGTYVCSNEVTARPLCEAKYTAVCAM